MFFSEASEDVNGQRFSQIVGYLPFLEARWLLEALWLTTTDSNHFPSLVSHFHFFFELPFASPYAVDPTGISIQHPPSRPIFYTREPPPPSASHETKIQSHHDALLTFTTIP